jgi:hypothetical protein
MKLLLIPLMLVGAGAGWLGLKPEATPADCPPVCEAEDCRVTIECTEHDTCLVTCYDASGAIVCQEEIACAKPCEKVCDKPCEAPGAKTAPAGGRALPCAK